MKSSDQLCSHTCVCTRALTIHMFSECSTHGHTHAYLHYTRIHQHTDTDIYAGLCTHLHVQACIHLYPHTSCIYAQAQAAHSYMFIHVCAHRHTCTHLHTCTRQSCTHAHASESPADAAGVHVFTQMFTQSFELRKLLGSRPREGQGSDRVGDHRARARGCEAQGKQNWAVTGWGRMLLASFAETQVTDDMRAR